jgi:MarR family transcriptional regulator, organic hydroperoxide resistance regulator
MALGENTTTRPELLENGSDHRFREMIYWMLAFGVRLDAVRNGLGALMDVSGPQYSMLIALTQLDEDGGTAVVDVANYLHVSGAFVTAEVNKLAKLGLVTKTKDMADKRRVLLSITDEGLRRLANLRTHQRPINDVLFGTITREQFHTIVDVFPLLVSQADDALHEIDYLLRKKSAEAAAG